MDEKNNRGSGFAWSTELDMKTKINFDSVFSNILKILNENREYFDTPVTIVRQINGTITVIVKSLSSKSTAELIAKKLHEALGPYSSGISSILLSEPDLIDLEDVVGSPNKIRVQDSSFETWIVDRLLTNQDWLRASDWIPPVPVIVAFSIKGGVGRSIALTVFARHLSKIGKRVVIMDLDLEAPGLGILLGEDNSKYGVTDWLVESLVDNAPTPLTNDYWFRVPSLSGGTGAVYCIPAYGSETKEYILKVGRVYLTTLADDGESWISLSTKLQILIQAIAQSEINPDVILIDSRAGLQDLGAIAVTQLGAEVMLFTRDEPQSWKNYSKLFEHLSKSNQVKWGEQDKDLRSRLKMVAAQISSTEEQKNHCVLASFDSWRDFYDQESEVSSNNISYALYEEAAPHFPTPIYFADPLRGFLGWEKGETIREEVLEIAFGEFCNSWTSRLELGNES